MNSTLNKIKLAKYRTGAYVLYQVPPVTTQYWTEQDWVNFIDAHGKWE